MVSKYIVVLTREVTADLRNLHDYLEREISRKYADRIFDDIVDLAESLETLPNRYKELGYENYRCVSQGNHMLIYTVDEENLKVNIQAVFDNRQDPKRLMDRLK